MRAAVKFTMLTLVFLGALALSANQSHAITGEGCAEGACSDCHSLNKQEASELLKGMVQRVDSVEFSEVPFQVYGWRTS